MASSHGSNLRLPAGGKDVSSNIACKQPHPTADAVEVRFDRLLRPPAGMVLIPNAAPQKKSKATSSAISDRAEATFETPSPELSTEPVPSHRAGSVASKEEKIDKHDEKQNEPNEVKNIPLEDKPEIDRCAICLDDCTEPKKLDKCGHIFCTSCIDHYFQAIKPQCPCCFTIYGEIRGNQPENGTMQHTVLKHRLPGFRDNSDGTIQITYNFPSGTQDERHPNPGQGYRGTQRVAYLPNNREGRHVLKLLKRAFELRQTFTVGQSRTTGYDNVVTWNDIHHKTSCDGGMENFGYPDKTYLHRVQQELAAKGIQ